MTRTLRALLALALLAGVYVIGALLGALWLVFAADALYARVHGTTNVALIGLVAFTPAAIFPVLAEVARLTRPIGPRADSITLTDDDRHLSQMVRELCTDLVVDMPHEIRLVPDANASVTEDVRLLGLRSGRRRLYVGIPLILTLTTEQLRAVLAHELAHYVGHHPRFSAPTFRGSMALSAALDRIRDNSHDVRGARGYIRLVHPLIQRYAAFFSQLVAPVRQRQEFEADSEAARLVGSGAMADAIRSASATDAAWWQFRRDVVEPVRLAIDLVPDDAFLAFASMMEDPDFRDTFRELHDHAHEQDSSADDSHPSIADRLDRLAPSSATVTETGATEPATTLVHDPDASRRLSEAMTVPASTTRIAWRDWMRRAATQRATTVLPALVIAVNEAIGSSPESQRPVLDDLLNLLESNRFAALTQEMTRALHGEEMRAEAAAEHDLARAIVVAIGHALVLRDRAYWTMRWTGHSLLVAHDTTAQHIEDWVRDAMANPTQVSRLRLQLAALGIDTTSAEVDPRPATTTVAHTPTPTTRNRRGRIAIRTIVPVAITLGIWILIPAFATGSTASDGNQPAYQDPAKSFQSYNPPVYRAPPALMPCGDPTYAPWRVGTVCIPPPVGMPATITQMQSAIQHAKPLPAWLRPSTKPTHR